MTVPLEVVQTSVGGGDDDEEEIDDDEESTIKAECSA